MSLSLKTEQNSSVPWNRDNSVVTFTWFAAQTVAAKISNHKNFSQIQGNGDIVRLDVDDEVLLGLTQDLQVVTAGRRGRVLGGDDLGVSLVDDPLVDNVQLCAFVERHGDVLVTVLGQY